MHAIVLYCVCLSEVVGTTTVKVTVLDADDEAITTADVKVTVKKNAAAVAVTGIADGDSFKVGQTVDITLPRAGVDTDARALVVDNADVVELKAGEKARTWTAKFLKAGDAKFTATAFQSKKFNKATATAEINVKVVAPAMTEVKQIASNSFKAYFDTDPTALNIKYDTVKIYSKNNQGIAVYDKVVKGTPEVNKDDNSVTFTTYSDFTKDVTYYVELDGVIKDFTGVDVSTVSYFEVDNSVVIKGQFNSLSVSYYNEFGMKLQNPNFAYPVEFETETIAKDGVLNGTQLYLANTGDVATVKAFYTKYDTNATGEKIYSKNVATLTARDNKEFTGTKLIVIDSDNTANQWTPAKNVFCIDDTSYLNIFFEYYYPKTYSTGYEEITVAGSGYNFESSAPNVFVINSDYSLTGVSAGNAYVLIKNADGAIVDNIAITVKAARYANSFTASLSNPNVNVNNFAADSTTFKIKVLDQYGEAFTGADDGSTDMIFTIDQLKNQTGNFGFAKPNASINFTGTWNGEAESETLTGITQSACPAGFVLNKTASLVLTIKGNRFGQYKNEEKTCDVVLNLGNYLFRTDAEIAANINTNGVTPTTYVVDGLGSFDQKVYVKGTANVQNVAAAGDNLYDSKKATIVAKYNNFKLADITTENLFNVYKDVSTWKLPETTSVNNVAAADVVTGTAFTYTLQGPDGKIVADSDFFTFSSDKLVIRPVKNSDPSTKLKAGTYTVNAYKIVSTAVADTVNTGKFVVQNQVSLIATSSLVVSDSQESFSVVQVAETYDRNAYSTSASAKANALTIFKKSFDVYCADKRVIEASKNGAADNYNVVAVGCEVDANTGNLVFTSFTINMTTLDDMTYAKTFYISKVVK